MLTKTGRFELATAVLCIGFGGGGRAAADLAITAPLALNPGDTFRIVFVTDATTTATSSSIGDYNTLVNTDAPNEAGGGAVKYGTPTLTRGPRSHRWLARTRSITLPAPHWRPFIWRTGRWSLQATQPTLEASGRGGVSRIL